MPANVCPLARCQRARLVAIPGERVTRRLGGSTLTYATARLVCPKCERRRAGICQDCPARVEGATGKALRCARCKRRARRHSDKKCRSRPEIRRRIAARGRRRYRTDAAYRDRRRAAGRDWARRNPEKKRRAARRLLLTEGPSREKYLATQRRHNADPVRIAKKRVWALARYYERHPVRPDPHCHGCSGRLEYSGVGLPPRWCDDCCSPAERARRRKLGRSIRVVATSVAMDGAA